MSETVDEVTPTPSSGSWTRIDTLQTWPISQPASGSWTRIDTLYEWPVVGGWILGTSWGGTEGWH
jgi:hypothetical protein